MARMTSIHYNSRIASNSRNESNIRTSNTAETPTTVLTLAGTPTTTVLTLAGTPTSTVRKKPVRKAKNSMRKTHKSPNFGLIDFGPSNRYVNLIFR